LQMNELFMTRINPFSLIIYLISLFPDILY
jgi:hypothetical protein